MANYCECPYCKEISLPEDGGECEHCGRIVEFHKEREVQKFIGHWFAPFIRSTGGEV